MMMVSDSLRRGAGRRWSKFSWGVDGWLTFVVEGLSAEMKPVLADGPSMDYTTPCLDAKFELVEWRVPARRWSNCLGSKNAGYHKAKWPHAEQFRP
jgi:hypothetical protein